MHEDIAAVLNGEKEWCVITADCLEVLPTLPDQCVDAVISDPPYPEIKRSYGYWTEEEWFALMRRVVPECMRVLKPTGSAVFILQPNSERLGRMRTWLWEFMAWVGREWGIVQDVWWWNYCAPPEAHSIQGNLLRPSIKACVWIGAPDCWRNQAGVLLPLSERMQRYIQQAAKEDLTGRLHYPSGHGMDVARVCATVQQRGGVSPFNVLPIHHGYGQRSAGAAGHAAGTPLNLCEWWVRYICPPGGVVLDPFAGISTVGLAALKFGCRFIGVETHANYCDIARRRLTAAEADQRDSLFPAREAGPQQRTFADLLETQEDQP